MRPSKVTVRSGILGFTTRQGLEVRTEVAVKIAVVTTSYPRDEDDPSGHFVRAEVREYEEAGHDVVVIAPQPGGAFGWPGVAARLSERGRFASRALEVAAWVAVARRRVEAARADRVVAHWAVPSAWPIAPAGRAPVSWFGGAPPPPVEVVSHGGDVRLLVGMPRLLRERVVMSIASRAVRWRFVSSALKEELLGALPGPSRAQVEGIAEVRGASLRLPDVTQAVIAKRRELAGLRYAVSVGRLVASKRVDRVIAHVAETRGVEALVVVGDGPERGRLEELARRRGVDARFVGLVPRAEALAWMGAAEVVLHASEREGLSTVVREAEALGVRCVVLG
jgi:glycosyltransferase involved in cell wall biosynthesis